MLKFLNFYVGNKDEAFYESRFKDGINIIYSDDNNKGKTIVLQGLYYALGNTPIFPSAFDYENYYFIIDLALGDKKISICRKNKTFLFRSKGNLKIFNSVSEFKRCFNEQIYALPRIIKDDSEKLSDLELFYQLFFVGQDKRDTSKIFNSGYNNKEDFMNMLYSYTGCTKIDSGVNIEEIIKKQKTLKEERELILKKEKFLREHSSVANLAMYTVDKDIYLKKIQRAEILNQKIISLKNERNRIQNRKLKNEALIGELRSLNRSLNEGVLVCLDCHGQHIGYENENKDINFDVSDSEIRADVMSAIQNRIDSAEEDLEITNKKILTTQNELKELLKDEDISLENIVLYKDSIQSSQSADDRINKIDYELNECNNLIKSEEIREKSNKTSKDALVENILLDMNTFYKTLEPSGNFEFDALFSRKDVNYSGSEECEFYLVKLYALAKILKHPFPIIIDAFREGEISTSKENLIIEKFGELSNQIIFSATLKDEELNKYDTFSNVNAIDYSKNMTHHILNEQDIPALLKKLLDFSIAI
ncbi:MAG: hypothetical protein J5716_02525 [Alphaproteobacteria bacterium]|nr:hypothetical protein [Alphaproteobacteria bacterium]